MGFKEEWNSFRPGLPRPVRWSLAPFWAMEWGLSLVWFVMKAAAGTFPKLGAAILLSAIVVPAFVWRDVLDKMPTLKFWTEPTSDASRSEVIRNVGLLAAGAIGVAFGIWRAITAHRQAQAALQQARTGERGHFTERFSKAVERLGSKELTVRIGGLHALYGLARDAELRDTKDFEPPDIKSIKLRDIEDIKSVATVLCAYIRNPFDGDTKDSVPATESLETGDATPTPRPDVAEAFLFIADPETGLRRRLPDDMTLNLKGASLAGITLCGADLRKADLREADLAGTILVNANFAGASLTRANLAGASLAGANLAGANLAGASLAGASLAGAKLTVASLTGANLSGATLAGADLAVAYLAGADLAVAYLAGADLTGATLAETYLVEAYLKGANLEGANLEGANLEGANLKGANLKRANLAEAILQTADLEEAELIWANLAGANLAVAKLAGANLAVADLAGANLAGANLAEAKNLTQEQLDQACLPDGADPPTLTEGFRPPPKRDNCPSYP